MSDKNAGCKNCDYYRHDHLYLDKETGGHNWIEHVCLREKNHEKIELWWGNWFYQINIPQDINKDRDCPSFKQMQPSEEHKEELTSFWSHIKGWFRRKND